MTFWTVNGVLVGSPEGVLVDCDHCPCEPAFCCRGVRLTVLNSLFYTAYTDQPDNLYAGVLFFDHVSDTSLGPYPRNYDFIIDPKSIQPPAPDATGWQVTGTYNFTYYDEPMQAKWFIHAHWDEKKKEWLCTGTIAEGGNFEEGFYDDTGYTQNEPIRFKVWEANIITGENVTPNAYQQSLPKELQ